LFSEKGNKTTISRLANPAIRVVPLSASFLLITYLSPFSHPPLLPLMHRRNPTLMGSPSTLPSLLPLSPPPPTSKSYSFPPQHYRRLSTSSSSFLSRHWLHRTTFLALFSLFLVSVYVLLVAGPSNLKLAPYHQPDAFRTAVNNFADANKSWKPSHKDIIASRPQISLTPQQELAAVSSFIISLPSQNVIPSSVDPSQPIDPQLVLDFDTRADGANAELNQLVAEVWDINPVVIYSKVLVYILFRLCINHSFSEADPPFSSPQP
jgi:hypothetical protein